MKSVVHQARLPLPLSDAVERIAREREITMSQLLRGSVLRTYQERLTELLGHALYMAYVSKCLTAGDDIKEEEGK